MDAAEAKKPRGRLCSICNQNRAALKRPKTLEQVMTLIFLILLNTIPWFVVGVKFFLCWKICRECFFAAFEDEIHRVIVDSQLFKPGERIAIGASGGKG